MALIRLREFAGELPAVDVHRLPDRNARRAANTRLWGGSLRPLRGLATVASSNTSGGDPKTIFRYDASTWLEWTSAVDVVRSLSPNDKYGRVYFTGDGVPKVTDSARVAGVPAPGDSYRWGVPAPTANLSLNNGGIATGDEGQVETRFYRYTLVNGYGEEGPPSPASPEIEIRLGEFVDLTIPAVPTGDYDFDKIYLYRLNTAGTEGEYLFVDEVTAGTTMYRDEVASSALGEELPSVEWDMPPDDLAGVIAAPGGYLAGFRRNEVRCSEPGLPHAWNLRYSYPVDSTVVGLGALQTGFVVCTDGEPHIARGSHPGSLTVRGLKRPYACLSKEGIVTVRGSVVYPSNEGLVIVNENGAELLTLGIFDREAWDALNPASMYAFQWRGLYLVFYTDIQGTTGGFMIDPRAPGDGIVRLTGIDVGSGYADPNTGALYLATNGQIYRWDAGGVWTYHWRSPPRTLAQPMPMTTLQVFAAVYPVVVIVRRDGQEQARVRVASSRARRVPNAAMGRIYDLEVTAGDEVRDVMLASSMEELRRV